MNLQENMDLQQQFEAAVSRVDGLPGDKAAPHMTELYGLYKQATEGDHDAKRDEVGDEMPDNPNGPAGMSQAQWDSWSKFKGVEQDEARRQYIDKVTELAGPVGEKPTVITGNGQPATGSQVNPSTADNSTTAQQPDTGPGVSQGGLRGDITAGAPYGGEDRLKDVQ
ncbi:acyl-CoA-binding protein [Microvirga sp. STR05]|uniref:Acyl-CoA-binding protein n=1 Tax=Hymenobacter duratus TaxID=2771356 RepID=A0ABR8JJD9_9BACT|nr:acyl-CoA-binding protein [Hymenobacter duratus]MBD2715741.1 acyl-CoA-binding protein [Hymenobacter duratus]MBR7950652.1 acyl-CoA-binding protein [Microvirga sp. STR05]